MVDEFPRGVVDCLRKVCTGFDLGEYGQGFPAPTGIRVRCVSILGGVLGAGGVVKRRGRGRRVVGCDARGWIRIRPSWRLGDSSRLVAGGLGPYRPDGYVDRRVVG